MYSTFSCQPKINQRIAHSVQQCVARRAQNPNLLWRGVAPGSPSAIPSMLRPVGNIEHAIFPAGLACAWRIGMARVKAFQVSVWAFLLSRLCVVLRVFRGVSLIKPGARLPRATDGAGIRAMPLVARAASFGKELRSTLSAMATFAQQLPRLPVISEFLLAIERAEFLPSSCRLEARPALATMLCARHA